MADGRGVFLATMALYCCILVKGSSVKATQYLLGTGIADITGTPADIEMMGYAMPQQIVGGLHTRLFARAFIFGDDVTVEQNEGKRFVFVSIDACMASQAVTLGVLDKLKEAYGDMYTAENVAISGIHTHAGPAGYLQYVLYTIPTKGFVSENYEIMVDGIFRAISRAHANLAPGHVELVQGELLHANINRSPTAYLANPAAERSRYRHDTDKTMTLLKLRRDDGMGIGAVNWFAVHCTSMNNTNRLISSDNKGQASMMMESWAAAQSRRQPRSNGGATGPGTAAWSRVITDPPQSGVSRHGKHSKHPHPHDKLSKHSHSHKSERLSSDFVAAFAQSNLGDVSPNVQGAFCLDTGSCTGMGPGKPCEMEHSTCNGRNELCHGRGPAWPDDFNSTAIIAERQLAKALQLWQQRGVPVAGGIDYRHAYIDISNLQVQATNRTRAGRTCTPAMGFSFAAGTTDGPGAFDFIQGQNHSTPFWRVVREFVLPPTNEHRECHAPKPILLDTGRGKLPYQWQPTIVDLGLLKLGQLVVLFVPGEFTTMAGRRIREAVKQELAAAYGHDMVVVLAGLTNTYSSYVATWEEYQVQRYEGASTLYGPHTLDAYIQEMLRLARSMAAGKPVDPGPQPPRLVREAEEWSLVPGVVADEAPAGKRFGDVVQDVGEHDYHPGDTVQVKFVSACPRNRIKIEESYLAVERLQDSCWQQLRGSRSPAALCGCALEEAQWHVVHTDADMCTRFLWDRPWVFAVTSYATIEWRIPADTAAGLYRIRHFGTRKTLFQHMSDFSGMSSYFHVTPPPASLARLRVKGPFRAAARLARQTWLLVRRGVRGLLSVAVHELAQ